MSGNPMGMQPVNINQMMIRPLVMQISVIVLFMLPMVTMRTYAEEKRSGTIELLLTAPLTDVQIILGKFLGALGPLRRDAAGHAALPAHPLRLRQPGLAAGRDLLSRAVPARRQLHRLRPLHLEHDRRTRSSPAS